MSEFISYVMRALGVPALIRVINRRKVAVLLYHDPSPSVFKSHLEYLSKNYNFVSFDDVVEALNTRNWSSLPNHAVVIHIDDGYLGNSVLTEICESYRVKPTLYLCSDVIGTQRRFWSKLAGGRSKHLRLVENRRLRAKLRDEADYSPERDYAGREALNTDELSAMTTQFDFQSHGRFHFSLLTLDDAELKKEFEDSRTRIENITGQTCDHFSFPYGDYSARELRAVKLSGYQTARTTRPGWIGPDSDQYQLPIVADVPASASINQLRLQLTGLPRFTKRLIYVLVTKHVYAVRERILMSRRFF